MKNFKILLVIVLSVLITTGLAKAFTFEGSVDEAKQLMGQEEPQEELGGYSGNHLITISTTTSATQNKMIFDINTTRRAGFLQNNSDTTIYFYCGTFASEVLASTTQMQNEPCAMINANGGTWNMENQDVLTGQLWVATTTAGKSLIGHYSQKSYSTLNPTNTY